MISRQRLFNLARLIHLYSSTALFASLAFFCITGLTLSHGWYLDESGSSGSSTIALPPELAANLTPDDWDPDLSALQQLIREQTKLSSPQNIELDREYGEIILSYNAPGGDAEVFVTADGMQVDVQRGSWLAVMNNLHKNRDAGTVWSLLVDITAIGMMLFALTGLIIVFQNRLKRHRSLWVVGLGLVTPVVLFIAFVPRIPLVG